MMCCGDFVDVLRLFDLPYKFIPGDLDHLIGDVIDEHCHEVLHLMSEEKNRGGFNVTDFLVSDLY